MVRRGWVTFALAAALAVFISVVGLASIANGAVVSNPTASECNTDGRAFCIDVTTWDGITASDPTRAGGSRYTWVEWEMRNEGGSTLTNPAVQVTFQDFNCSAVVPPPPAQGPLTGCTALAQSSAIVASTIPSGCSASGSGLVCTYANIPAAPGATGVRRVYFKTANEPATHTRITVRGTVKERGRDHGGNPTACDPSDPNCDTFATFVNNSYEPVPNAAFTFALNGNPFYLETDDALGLSSLGASSFTFTSGSAAIFRAEFRSNQTACPTPSPTCFQRELSVLSFDESVPGSYNSGPLVFYARLTDVPSGVTDKSVVAIHTYDDATTQVIGDQASERSDRGCTFTHSNQIPVPSICAKKVQGMPKALDVWVWDNRNGGIKFG